MLQLPELSLTVRFFFLLHADPISIRTGFNSVTKNPHKRGTTHLFADQKASLEALFAKNKFPNGHEKSTMAVQLGISLGRVQVGQQIFSNSL